MQRQSSTKHRLMKNMCVFLIRPKKVTNLSFRINIFSMPLRRSKSLFGTDKLEEGYLDPISLRKAHLVTSAMDDDDDEDEDGENDENKHNAQVGILGGENPEGSEASSPPCKGGPFSALTSSMWPSKGNKIAYLDVYYAQY